MCDVILVGYRCKFLRCHKEFGWNVVLAIQIHLCYIFFVAIENVPV